MSLDEYNADYPIYPSRVEIDGDNSYHCIGLTKREHFAAMAMQGLLASENSFTKGSDSCDEWLEDVTDGAIKMADALLKELSK